MISSAPNACSHLNDQELLNLLVKGDEAAYSEIYNRYWKKLFTTAFNKLNDLSEAEEVVQDIFLDLWHRRESLKVTASFSAYLSMAVKYKSIDRFAKRAQQLRYQQYAAYFESPKDLSTQNWLDYEELRERLVKSVVELPEKCRLVFELSRNNGLSQKQIAVKMGIAEKTVESHLSKALRTLRINLGSFFILLMIFIFFSLRE